MIDEILADAIPGYVEIAEEVIEVASAFFAAGVLVSFIAWALAIAIHAVFVWLGDWSR